MSRLQKKCFIASAAMHVLLALFLFVGPGFLLAKKKSNDLPIINVVPARLIDDLLSGGGTPRAAPPPPNTPRANPAPPAQPKPLPPPEPAPARPKPEPVAEKPIEKPLANVERAPEPKPPKNKPIPRKASDPERETSKVKPAPTKQRIEVDLTERPRNPKSDSAAKARAETEAKARAAADARREQFASALQNLKSNLSSGTVIDIPGPGGEAYANYGQVVKSVYENAWVPPANIADENATVSAKVILARDGSVVSAEILRRSGAAPLDRSVDRVLKQIKFVAPFPEGAKDDQRTFFIDFNLKAKRSLG